ncbi:MAG: GNAT family N-acetyltransferase [Anaerolineae bacterium]|nr:GNAT family N-acetyltransferase [Anaerolineae bacterium]
MTATSTLTIRGQQNDDLDQLYTLWSFPDVLLDSVELPYLSDEAFRDRFGTTPPHTHTLIAEVGLPGGRTRITGFAWLETFLARRRHAGRLNLLVHPDHQGTDAESALLEAVLDLADNWLGLRRIEVHVYIHNAPAVALYERYGFEIEATMRRYALRRGVYDDAYIMARLHTVPVDQHSQGKNA